MIRKADLSAIPRCIGFPYPVYWILESIADTHKKQLFLVGNLYHVCLRLASTNNDVEEEIDGIHYRKSIPHVAVKLPHTVYNYGLPYPRDAIAICYTIPVMNLLKSIGLELTAPHHPLMLSEKMYELVHELQSLLGHSYEFGTADRIDQVCFRIIAELALQKDEMADSSMPDREKIMSCASFFNLRYNQAISYEQVAGEHGFSFSTFLRRWKLYFTETPGEYVTRLRMDEAKRQLSQSRLPVRLIAANIGFRNENYFCASFKKHCGCSPLAYRAQHLNFHEIHKMTLAKTHREG